MNRLLLIALLSILTSSLCAQTYNISMQADVIKGYSNYPQNREAVENFLQTSGIDNPYLTILKAGDKLNIKGIKQTVQYNNLGKPNNLYYLLTTDKTILIDKKILSSLNFHINSTQDLWNKLVITDVIPDIQKKGIQYDLRSDMESDALEYISKIKSYGLQLDDPLLENYIYGLISKITPTELIDGRPVNVNILIEENPIFNAAMYPNGTLIISTGLLSSLHSEDELVAILAHEIAHFVLDHSVSNVNAALTRKKRAEFWAAVATGVTAVAEGIATAKSNSYIPGGATIGMALLSITGSG